MFSFKYYDLKLSSFSKKYGTFNNLSLFKLISNISTSENCESTLSYSVDTTLLFLLTLLE